VLDTDYYELKQEKLDVLQREREMERSALRLLQHHPWKHAIRLLLAAIGFKIQLEIEPIEDIRDVPQQATS
jgi:hypothetical protein